LNDILPRIPLPNPLYERNIHSYPPDTMHRQRLEASNDPNLQSMSLPTLFQPLLHQGLFPTIMHHTVSGVLYLACLDRVG
jgi:hypothetical protein